MTTEQVAQFLGPELIAHACDIGHEQAQMLTSLDSRDYSELNEPREARVSAFNELVSAAKNVLTGATNPWTALTDLVKPTAEESLVNQLRESVGGEFPTVDSNDPVTAPLLGIAIDVFPIFLIPRVDFVSDEIIQDHASHSRFLKQLQNDEKLQKLFRGGEATYVYNNVGSAGILPRERLAAKLINGAWWYCCLQGRMTLEDLLRRLADLVNKLRDLVTGKPIDEVCQVTMFSVELPPDTRLETPWGILRSHRSSDEMFLRPFSETLEQLFPSFQSDTPGSLPRPAAMLETSFPYQWQVHPALKPDEEPPANRLPAVNQLGPDAAVWALLGLAFSLALQPIQHDARPIRPLLYFHFDPLRGIRGGSSFGSGSAMMRKVTRDEAQEAERWCEKIHSHLGPSRYTAARRIQSSLEKWRRPADGLIDAVIAWDNIFGDRRAIAVLLEPPGPKREKLQDAVKKIYDARSKLVHGGRLKPKKVAELHQRALEIAIRALQYLVEHKPELLSESRNFRPLISALGGELTGAPMEGEEA